MIPKYYIIVPPQKSSYFHFNYFNSWLNIFSSTQVNSRKKPATLVQHTCIFAPQALTLTRYLFIFFSCQQTAQGCGSHILRSFHNLCILGSYGNVVYIQRNYPYDITEYLRRKLQADGSFTSWSRSSCSFICYFLLSLAPVQPSERSRRVYEFIHVVFCLFYYQYVDRF